MVRITWDGPGTRFYETGVDRGVFYPASGAAGVSWSGLIGVTENVSGGEATPLYYDGVKYLDVVGSEDFQATIEAYSSPAEFADCDGIKSLATGLFVTGQPRNWFGMSYRTLVGNDLDADAGYKIHLVYNAMALPSARANKTKSDKTDPMTKSWTINTVPPFVTDAGYKPTAHVILDSRKVNTLLLAYLEGILYGTTTSSPRLPLIGELLTIFAMPEFAVAWSGTANQSKSLLKSGYDSHSIMQNEIADPRATGAVANTSDTLLHFAKSSWGWGTGTTGTYASVTGASDGPPLSSGWPSTSYLRKAWTSSTDSLIDCTGTGIGILPRIPVTPGQYVFLSARMRTSHIANMSIDISLWDVTGNFGVLPSGWDPTSPSANRDGNPQPGVTGLPVFNLQPNVWKTVFGRFLVPKDVYFLTAVFDRTSKADNGAIKWVSGDTLDASFGLISLSNTAFPKGNDLYFDGDDFQSVSDATL